MTFWTFWWSFYQSHHMRTQVVFINSESTSMQKLNRGRFLENKIRTPWNQIVIVDPKGGYSYLFSVLNWGPGTFHKANQKDNILKEQQKDLYLRSIARLSPIHSPSKLSPTNQVVRICESHSVAYFSLPQGPSWTVQHGPATCWLAAGLNSNLTITLFLD